MIPKSTIKLPACLLELLENSCQEDRKKKCCKKYKKGKQCKSCPNL